MYTSAKYGGWVHSCFPMNTLNKNESLFPKQNKHTQTTIRQQALDCGGHVVIGMLISNINHLLELIINQLL